MILLARLLAVVGEMSWTVQIARALKEVGESLECNVGVSMYCYIVLIACAECFSTIGTLTKNSLWFTLEESSWVASALLFVTPTAIRLKRKHSRLPDLRAEHINKFLNILLVVLLVYDIWGVTMDVPSNLKRYNEERYSDDAGWLSLWDGVKDTTGACLVDRSEKTWAPYTLWMTAYFSLGVWSSLALASFDTRLKQDTDALLPR